MDVPAAVGKALEATAGNVESLAEEVGVQPHTLWAWKAGRRHPRPDNLRKLADALERRGADLTSLAGEIRTLADGD